MVVGSTHLNSTMNATFDTNCLVDLELDELAAPELRRIVGSHDSGRLTISVPGIGASERLKDGTFARDFSVFRQRINALAKREFDILRPPLYLDLAYLDWAILGGDDTLALERQIHEVLFPETLFHWPDQAAALRLDPNQAAEQHHREWLKWRNRKCDTLALWCHIHYDKDVFVTRDGNFHKATKKAALEKLGAKRILQPFEVPT
jgi:hypothetical protein